MHDNLDHIVLLLPYSYLTNPPAWISSNFTLSPGGRHGDDKTENRLILFRDGTYLELIAFINDDPERRKGHWWDKLYGVVDYALAPTKPLDYDSLVARLEKSNTDITYAPPKQGGRSTGGHDIKWNVTFPPAASRGQAPFFCEDITPREWRVPVTEESSTHPCGAMGTSGILLEVKGEKFDELCRANAAALDTDRTSNEKYEIDTPYDIPGLKKPSIRLQRASSDSKQDLSLTLFLQTGSKESPDPIRQPIDDGVVSIEFE